MPRAVSGRRSGRSGAPSPRRSSWVGRALLGPGTPPATRDRGERNRDRQQGPQSAVPAAEPQKPSDVDQPFGDLRPLNTQAQAFVISVVDERTLGPVTRSKLTLRVQPKEGDAFEVTTRVAFPTPEDRRTSRSGGRSRSATTPTTIDG